MIANAIIKFIAWIQRKLIISYAKNAKHTSLSSFIEAKSNDGGDYDVYFMTSDDGTIIVDSILIHCNKYKEHIHISDVYISKSWKYAMDGANIWCFSDCDLQTALDVPQKLVMDYEIKQLMNNEEKQ